jgi:nucleotide-binding universal stress UspA family protein
MKLLVALDLSEATEKIVVSAESLATALSARMWILHVAEPDPDFVGWKAGPQTVRDDMAKQFRDEHRQVQQIAAKLHVAGVDATAVLVQGPTVEKILEQASRLNVDMIILGSHGRSAVYHLLVGSVSEGVLQESECPVLVVPTRQRT